MGLAPRQLTLDWGVTGLAGTLAYRVVDLNNADLIARTTAGVVEFPAGSGCYCAIENNWDESWGAKVIWDDGTGTPDGYVTEWEYPATAPAVAGARPVTFTVKTAGNTPLQNALVTVLANGIYQTRTSDASGHASFSLADGAYTVSAALAGYTFTPSSDTVSSTATAFDVIGTAVTIPTPGNPSQLVGIGKIYGPTVASQNISYRLAVPPASIAGGVWDGTTQTVQSDSQGNISVDLYLGGEYEFWWGENSEHVGVVVPTSGTSMTLPTIISPASP